MVLLFLPSGGLTAFGTGKWPPTQSISERYGLATNVRPEFNAFEPHAANGVSFEILDL
jgi:hypothetical protein